MHCSLTFQEQLPPQSAAASYSPGRLAPSSFFSSSGSHRGTNFIEENVKEQKLKTRRDGRKEFLLMKEIDLELTAIYNFTFTFTTLRHSQISIMIEASSFDKQSFRGVIRHQNHHQSVVTSAE